jgi:electron transport complex protein RnfG
MKKHIKSVISLTAICAVVALLLGVTNFITAPIIKKQEDQKVAKALLVVLPNGEEFKNVDLSSYKLPATVTEAYSEKNGGYVFKMTTTGYASGLVVLCGVDSEGKVTGATCIASSETNGAEKDYGSKFINKTADEVDSIDTVSGSTKTTLAYKNAVKDALNSFTILNGGSVDIRSEEEILADNLKTALSAADGKFTEVFITEDIGDISAVYSADNGAGFVFLKGENFVATDSQGNVLTETEEALKTEVTSAAQKITSSKLTEIDITKYENISELVEKVYKTQSGNYVFELKAAGYGVRNQYGSGEYIKIKVSLTGEGKIIACKTVSQKESENYGDACGKPSFYKQFNGKDETTYSEIDAISGATTTTKAYKNAIAKAFETLKILKGEA